MSVESRDPGFVTGPVTFALLILVALLVIRGTEPPPAGDEKTPLTEFSSARAMRDVREIAQRPHPLASPDNDRVREYLLGRLRELGANPQVQTATVARHVRGSPDVWAVVHNVVGKIPGTNSTGAVLMVAHYDSVPSGPGAGDDASSVAAILETLRALKASAPLRNDLMVLFSDGEELGLLGAQGFVENYAALPDVKVVLNFEMRGDAGPSMLFQTSAHDSWLVDQFAGAAPYPRGTSGGASVYRLMPNDTDLTVFLNAGMTGMNFAATGGISRYHTELDNAANLDLRTLQHQGSYALSMAQRFGTIILENPKVDDAVFFVAGAGLVHYTARLALPLAMLITVLVLSLIGIAIRDRRCNFSGVAGGVAVYVFAIAVAVLEARGVWTLMAWLAGYRMLPSGTTYAGGYYTLAAIAVVIGTLWALYGWANRLVRVQNLGAGAIVVWTVVMLATSIWLPGVSYVFAWPLFFAALAMGYRSGATNGHATIRPAVWTLVGLVPGTAILAPSFAVSSDGTILFLMFSGLTAVLLVGLYVPYMDLLTSGRRWIVPALCGALTIAMLVAGDRQSRFSVEQPHPDSIFYLLDVDLTRAAWMSLDSQPDTFTAQFFQSHVRGGWLARRTGLATKETPPEILAKIPARMNFSRLNGGHTIEGDAPMIKAAPPVVTLLDDSDKSGTRVVKVHIASARKAPIVWMSVPVGVTVFGASIDGKSAGDLTTNGWSGWYWNAPARGFDLELKIANVGPIVMSVIDQTAGLPQTKGFTYEPRPAGAMPSPFIFFDSSTLVRKRLAIGGETISQN